MARTSHKVGIFAVIELPTCRQAVRGGKPLAGPPLLGPFYRGVECAHRASHKASSTCRLGLTFMGPPKKSTAPKRRLSWDRGAQAQVSWDRGAQVSHHH